MQEVTLLYSYKYQMIQIVGQKPSNKCADITRYRHAYSILHIYSDALECCPCMTLLLMRSNSYDVAGKRVARLSESETYVTKMF